MAVLSRVIYHQDETFQSVEVAHKMVFGRGSLPWEWLIDTPIRSSLHPLVFTPVLFLLKVIGLDYVWLVVLAPRLVQATISAVSDHYFFRFFKYTFLQKTTEAKSFFVIFYCANATLMFLSSRTFINTLEMNLSSIALFYYSRALKEGQSLDKQIYVGLITVGFAIRTTTALFWLPLVLNHVGVLLQTGRVWSSLIMKMIPVAFCCLVLTSLVDSVYYGSVVFVPWNFVNINIFQGISEQFGREPWHFYLLHTLPRMLNVALIFLPLGVAKVWQKKANRIYIIATFWTVFCMSASGHKEDRFLLSLLPILLAFCAIGATQSKTITLNPTLVKVYVLFNLIYVTILHDVTYFGSTQSDITAYLASLFEKGGMTGVYFLVGCRGAPFYSHFHHDVPLLTPLCPPRLNETSEDYHDVNFLSRDPEGWFELKFGANLTTNVPSHMVLFDHQTEWPVVQKFLQVNQMHLCKQIGITQVFSKNNRC